MPNDEFMNKTFSKLDLERAATAFVLKHGAQEDLEWRWHHAGMLLEFIQELFAEAFTTGPLEQFSEAADVPGWYAEQTKRFEALKAQGWRFDTAPARPGQAGVRMISKRTTIDLYTDASRPYAEAREALLSAAEKLAAMHPTTPRG